jgi:hypothetical protein
MITTSDSIRTNSAVSTDSIAKVKHQPTPVTVQETDTIQYLGVLPDVFPLPKVASDTLPKLNVVPYVPKNVLKLTPYHSMREFAPGIEGRPISEDLCTNDVMTTIIFTCAFIILFVMSRTHKFVFRRIHDFFVIHKPARKFIADTSSDTHSMVMFITQTMLFVGIIFFSHFIYSEKDLSSHVSPYIILLVYVISCFLYFCLKWIAYYFLGWIFFTKQQTIIFVRSYSTLISFLGFVLFPFILMLVFAYISPKILLTISIYILVFAKILIFYKWLKLFSPNFFQVFLLILYFCALEIIPCFLFYQGVIQMNIMLIKNF